MTTVWTPDVKLSGASSIIYDDTSTTYDQATINYIGQLTTVWTNDTKA